MDAAEKCRPTMQGRIGGIQSGRNALTASAMTAEVARMRGVERLSL